jgi:hypothetical protein
MRRHLLLLLRLRPLLLHQHPPLNPLLPLLRI